VSSSGFNAFSSFSLNVGEGVLELRTSVVHHRRVQITRFSSLASWRLLERAGHHILQDGGVGL
jgi:hypothetical protein